MSLINFLEEQRKEELDAIFEKEQPVEESESQDNED